MEKDVYEKAAEILKKEMSDNLKEFSNQEKAMVIIALRDKYTFPSPILNSVMSVNHFLFGLSA